MRILHYFLGFDRAGGLNRYAGDLAKTQARAGHEVFVLCPVGSLMRGRPEIRHAGLCDGVDRYQLIGGRPIPLLMGVRDPGYVNRAEFAVDKVKLQKFCDKIKVDIFHIHTWMGFPDELLFELKSRGTKVIFTTHDYFGLCPKVNFIDGDGNVCGKPENERCSRCNFNAPSDLMLGVRNCPLLLKMKNLLQPLARPFLRRRGKATSNPVIGVRDYESLVRHHVSLLHQCDMIHCNSEVTRGVYQRFVDDVPMKVVPITHCGIRDRRKERGMGDVIELTFSGPGEKFKGLPMLLGVLREFYRDGYRNWHLSVWGHSGRSDCPAISYRGRYSSDKKESVFGQSDLLIVPSLWNETFGLVVPEALSCGTPVLCSDTVGAKILVRADMIYHGEDGLRRKLKRILDDPSELARMRADWCSGEFLENMEQHSQKIIGLYGKFL